MKSTEYFSNLSLITLYFPVNPAKYFPIEHMSTPKDQCLLIKSAQHERLSDTLTKSLWLVRKELDKILANYFFDIIAN